LPPARKESEIGATRRPDSCFDHPSAFTGLRSLQRNGTQEDFCSHRGNCAYGLGGRQFLIPFWLLDFVLGLQITFLIAARYTMSVRLMPFYSESSLPLAMATMLYELGVRGNGRKFTRFKEDK